MALEHQISKELRARGYRVTPQRLVILRVLQEAGRHLTPGEICQRAQELAPGLTEATVYRTLAFLAEEQLALAAHVGGGQLVYEVSAIAHHHLICRKCSGEAQIGDEMFQELYGQLHAATGFVVDGWHVTLFGLCPHCQPKPEEIKE